MCFRPPKRDPAIRAISSGSRYSRYLPQIIYDFLLTDDAGENHVPVGDRLDLLKAILLDKLIEQLDVSEAIYPYDYDGLFSKIVDVLGEFRDMN